MEPTILIPIKEYYRLKKSDKKHKYNNAIVEINIFRDARRNDLLCLGQYKFGEASVNIEEDIIKLNQAISSHVESLSENLNKEINYKEDPYFQSLIRENEIMSKKLQDREKVLNKIPRWIQKMFI